MFPVFPEGSFNLLYALGAGVAFGFFLERAGLGNARKLVAQFYLTDMTVFKMMFSAILTAMAGIFFLTWMGWMDFARLAFTDTYWGAQLLGGLLLGIGFVMGGYCPGTCVVGMAGSKRDALWFLGGMIGGMWLFGESFDWWESVYLSGQEGNVFLPHLFQLSYGATVFAVIVSALAAFFVAEIIENRINR